LGVLLVAEPEHPASTTRREARTMAVEATDRVVKRAIGLMLRRRGYPDYPTKMSAAKAICETQP
jgi:hypothetical protein